MGAPAPASVAPLPAGIDLGSGGHHSDPNRVFVGGLPHYLMEDQVGWRWAVGLQMCVAATQQFKQPGPHPEALSKEAAQLPPARQQCDRNAQPPPSPVPPKVRELLQSFGAIRIMELIMDKETGKSKG